MKKISSDEMMEIAGRLEQYHAVFYQLLEIGQPDFTTSIPTACVVFQDGINVGFKINPKFWKSLSTVQRDFVTCHECLHVLLSHGMRMIDTENPEACNIAMDVVVNELLVSKFGFDRKLIDPKNKYIWKDKIFPDKSIEDDQTFEYYYNHLQKLSTSKSGSAKMKGFGETVDDHKGLRGNELPQDVIERLADKLSSEEKQKLSEALSKAEEKKENDQAGNVAGQIKQTMENVRVQIKRKWQTLLTKWTKSRRFEEQNEQWIRANRRLANIDSSIFLPSEMEDQEAPDKKIATIYLFLDTSGSCASIAPRFWKAYKSIPEDAFDIKLFCFDTRTYPVDPKKRQLFGFGGTAFGPIETRVKSESKCGKYPDAIWVFTDGQGSHAHPEKPERWHWFLTHGGRLRDQTYYIPEKSHSYKLSDFE